MQVGCGDQRQLFLSIVAVLVILGKQAIVKSAFYDSHELIVNLQQRAVAKPKIRRIALYHLLNKQLGIIRQLIAEMIEHRRHIMHQLKLTLDLILQRLAVGKIPFQRRVCGKQCINLLLGAAQHNRPFYILFKIIQYTLHQHSILSHQQRRNVSHDYAVSLVIESALIIVNLDFCHLRTTNLLKIHFAQIVEAKQLRHGKFLVVNNKTPVDWRICPKFISTPFTQKPRLCRLNGRVNHTCHSGSFA